MNWYAAYGIQTQVLISYIPTTPFQSNVTNCCTWSCASVSWVKSESVKFKHCIRVLTILHALSFLVTVHQATEVSKSETGNIWEEATVMSRSGPKMPISYTFILPMHIMHLERATLKSKFYHLINGFRIMPTERYRLIPSPILLNQTGKACSSCTTFLGTHTSFDFFVF